jgi:hypothetical protein
MRIVPENALSKSEVIQLDDKDWDRIYQGYTLLPDDLQKEKYNNRFSQYLNILIAIYQIGIVNR